MATNDHAYVHGYQQHEAIRLRDQATTLEDYLHRDTAYPASATVLEAGCGVGAQTLALARNSPGAEITAVDISAESLGAARARAAEAGLVNVKFVQADIHGLPFPPASFDHVFVCFVLEHLPQPLEALVKLRSMLKPGGTITVIEGDHGSTHFFPEGDAAREAIECLVELQKRAGGNALIGRQLYPLLVEAGFSLVSVSPRMVYVDSSMPHLVEGFTRRTFAAMINAVRDRAVSAGLIDLQRFDQGIAELLRATEEDGVFNYTFFKAVGRS